MAKDAFYFSHDYGSRNDPKLQKVLMKMGHEGKSVYWDLVEMLYEEGGYLKLAEFENYAFALRTNEDCITKLITDFGLFDKNEECFWSDSILRRLDRRDEKSKKASDNAKMRWEKANALKLDADALRQEEVRNALKERKGKDSKGKESKDNDIGGSFVSPETEKPIETPDELMEKRKKVFKERLYPFTKYPKNPTGMYPAETIKDFFEYWTEPNKAQSKMRFEMEKTWDLKLRLNRWASNNYGSKSVPATTTGTTTRKIDHSHLA